MPFLCCTIQARSTAALTQWRPNHDVLLTTPQAHNAKVHTVETIHALITARSPCYGTDDATKMPYNKQRVYLIRHGETEWSVSGQHTGTTDISLTAKGRAVAKRLAPILAEESFALVLVSPLQRARQTCELAGLGAHATIDRDLCEWNYGQYEGLTPAQIRAQAPEWLIFRDGCPGGETPAQAGARADSVIAKARASEGNIALFGHGHILRVLAARWVGLPASGGSHFLLHTATLSVLSYYHGIGAIECWNTALAP